MRSAVAPDGDVGAHACRDPACADTRSKHEPGYHDAMRLVPREIDKLLLHQAGVLAQKRLARGLRLSYPEAVALIATQLLELIRDGRPVAELMDVGRTMLGRRQVMGGVPARVRGVPSAASFPAALTLVTVPPPIVSEHAALELALYGSFLPVPP